MERDKTIGDDGTCVETRNSRHTVRLAGVVHDIESWLISLEQLSDHKKCKAPSFLRPYHFVTTALLAKSRGFNGLKLPGNLEAYATRMNLWTAAGLKSPIAVNQRNPLGRFLPIQSFTDKACVDTSANHLANILGRQSPSVDADSSQSLHIAMIELLNNCFDHAGESSPGLYGQACAQAWPSGNLAQIAIADAGEGIRHTLSGNPSVSPRLVHENACLLATELGVTGKLNDHSGYGLALARDVLVSNGGRLIVISGTEFALCSSNGISVRSTKTPWKGSLIIFEWRTDRPLDVTAVYESWPLAEGFDNDDFF
ncbi:ATP-binding protein [Acidihalobacter ferrooxydans]|uniref:ATP-binding protein n=1 Tax=Acidihalobacter ferrooxydans TaxID=1765967 RepID=UPI0012EBAC3A|nr:ATP-binding protein [Acidihalobacter ferrooxydans]